MFFCRSLFFIIDIFYFFDFEKRFYIVLHFYQQSHTKIKYYCNHSLNH